MIEAFPFGRRQVRFELLPLIAAIEATVPRPQLVTSLRDILQRGGQARAATRKRWRLVNAHFDRVLVHGDPAFAALGDSFPLADQIADRVVYTGLVCGTPPGVPDERFDVVVSAGGGRGGGRAGAGGSGAAALLPETGTWAVITGPNLPQAEFDELAGAGPGACAADAVPDAISPRFCRWRELSISQAGYNTVGDVLQAGVPRAADPLQQRRRNRAGRPGRRGWSGSGGQLCWRRLRCRPGSMAEAVKRAPCTAALSQRADD